jgi:hypothetical protein
VRGLLASRRSTPATSADLLPITALTADGLAVLESGAYVRWIEVSPANPLIQDPEGVAALSRAFAQVAGRLGAEQRLQLVAHATPLKRRRRRRG